ncbi:acyl-CoA dehydrogenase family protein [Pseudomonas lopnurensis]|uniref:acyl-CoA dehydrogenase family protein n=1 Tax=Pseudomonas lopnurensis TaxID=1477517 RepID=UPI0028A9331F|nr:acyl-CoA dehydrogenase family protein [Pseudomonas lopnurensis]
MDFALTDTQTGLRELAGRIFAEQASQQRLRQLDQVGYYDSRLWRQLAESGLLGITLDEATGGVGEDFTSLSVLLEEAARHVAPVPLLEVLVGGALLLQWVPACEQSGAALKALARGEAMICAALHEPGQRHWRQVSTRATHQGEAWHLSGAKHLVAAADQPGVCWTLAQTREGMGLFLFDLQAAGISRERQVDTTGEYRFALELDEVAAVCLAVADEVPALLERLELHLMTACAVMAVGACSEMTRLAVQHTSEREQFGKPLASFQAVAHRLADCHIDIEALRGLVQQALCRLERPSAGAEVVEAVLAAKAFAGEALHRVSHATQQVHGGTGVDRDYPLFRYCLLAKKLELAHGCPAEVLQRLGAALAA